MSDPKRLLDELESADGDLPAMLRAGKSELPDGAQLGALAAKLGIAAGVAGAAGAAGLGGSASAGSGTSAGAAAGASVAKAGLAIKIGGALAVASAVGVSATIVATTRHDAPPAPVGIVASAAPIGTTSGAAALPVASAEPSAPETPPSASASAPPSVKTAAPSESGAEGEVRLLERAQDALRSSPSDALALADEHARKYPRGMLAQEREVIAIEALAKLGRTKDLTARANAFKARFPGSSHVRRVDALLEHRTGY